MKIGQIYRFIKTKVLFLFNLQNNPAASKLPIKDNFTYDDYRYVCTFILAGSLLYTYCSGCHRIGNTMIYMWDIEKGTENTPSQHLK